MMWLWGRRAEEPPPLEDPKLVELVAQSTETYLMVKQYGGLDRKLEELLKLKVKYMMLQRAYIENIQYLTRQARENEARESYHRAIRYLDDADAIQIDLALLQKKTQRLDKKIAKREARIQRAQH